MTYFKKLSLARDQMKIQIMMSALCVQNIENTITEYENYKMFLLEVCNVLAASLEMPTEVRRLVFPAYRDRLCYGLSGGAASRHRPNVSTGPLSL